MKWNDERLCIETLEQEYATNTCIQDKMTQSNMALLSNPNPSAIFFFENWFLEV